MDDLRNIETREIKKVDLTIVTFSKDFADFQCCIEGGESVDTLFGLIHVPDIGKTGVILDGARGCYFLGEYHCPDCAAQAISDLYVRILIAERKCGQTYDEYKTSVFMGEQTPVTH